MPISRQPGFLNPTPVKGGAPIKKLPNAGKAVGGSMKRPMVTKSRETPRAKPALPAQASSRAVAATSKSRPPMIQAQRSRRGY